MPIQLKGETRTKLTSHSKDKHKRPVIEKDMKNVVKKYHCGKKMSI